MLPGYRMIAAVVVVCLFGLHQRLLASDSIEAPRIDIQQRINDLDASVEEAMQGEFYRKRDAYGFFSREGSSRFAELQMFVEVGRIELAQYKLKRRSLLIAKHIIDGKFLNAGSQYKWLWQTRSAADYVVSRLVQRACEGEINLTEHRDSRKRIHLLSLFYYSTTTIKYHARNYFLRLRNRKYLAIKSKDIMQQALERFQKDILNHVPEGALSDVLNTVDAMIIEAESQYEDNELAPEFMKRFERDVQATAQEATRRSKLYLASGRLDTDGLDKEIKKVDMEEVLQHETSVTEFPLGYVMLDIADPTTKEVVHEASWRMNRLDWEFEDYIAIDFHDTPVRLHREHHSNLPIALSVLLAECSGMLYATESRILRIMQDKVRQLFVTRTIQLDDSLVHHSNLIQLVMRRSFSHAIEAGLARTSRARKEIYLILTRNEQQTYLKELVRRFYEGLRERMVRYGIADRESFKLLRKYKNDVSYVLPRDSQMANTLRAVDKIIDDAIQEDNADLMSQGLEEGMDLHHHILRDTIGQDLYDEIARRAQEVKSMGYGFSQDELNASDVRDVFEFENILYSQFPPREESPR